MSNLVNSEVWYYKNADGEVEVIDVNTGEVLAVQPGIGSNLVERNDTSRYIYNPVIADLIATEVADGKSLTAACEQEGFPPLTVIRHWKNNHPEFNGLLNLARRERAEYFREAAIRMADGLFTKDEVSALRFKSETYWRAASHDYPEVYGTKQSKVEHSGTVTSKIIIETGIRRISDPGFFVDESKQIEKDVTLCQATPPKNEEKEKLGKERRLLDEGLHNSPLQASSKLHKPQLAEAHAARRKGKRENSKRKI